MYEYYPISIFTCFANVDVVLIRLVEIDVHLARASRITTFTRLVDNQCMVSRSQVTKIKSLLYSLLVRFVVTVAL